MSKPVIPPKKHAVNSGIFTLVGKKPVTGYKEYLISPEWKYIRDKRLQYDGYRCRICNTAKNLQVHHRTYARIYKEELDDLTTLCGDCHEMYHVEDKHNDI